MKRSRLRRTGWKRKPTPTPAGLVEGREVAMRRDGYCCQASTRGMPGKCWPSALTVQAHHINRDRTDNRPDNIVTLCPWHHTEGGRQSVHGNPALAFELGLLERKNAA